MNAYHLDYRLCFIYRQKNKICKENLYEQNHYFYRKSTLRK